MEFANAMCTNSDRTDRTARRQGRGRHRAAEPPGRLFGLSRCPGSRNRLPRV